MSTPLFIKSRVDAVNHNKEVPGVFMFSSCLCGVFSGYSQKYACFSHLDSLNLSLDVVLSVFVCPLMHWRPVQGVLPAFSKPKQSSVRTFKAVTVSVLPRDKESSLLSFFSIMFWAIY